MTTTTKKAFDLSRNSIYVADPDELCIIGGKKSLPDDEQGPLDTNHDKGEHELWDERLFDVIEESTVANVDYYGVIEPIIIAKDPETGVPMVVDGRGRVRRARRANLLRAQRGEPRIKIDCKVTRSTGFRLMGAMIACNEVRTDDGPLVKLEKAKRLMERGASEEDAATTFGLDLQWFRQLLAYDDAATPEVKEAVAAGEMSPTAAVQLVNSTKDRVTQAKALANVREKTAATGKRASVKDAQEAAKRATGRVSETGAGLIPSRKELGALLKLLAKNTAEKADEARVLLDDEKGISGIETEQRHVIDAFFVGAEAMLKVVLGKGDDVTILGMLAKARKELAKAGE